DICFQLLETTAGSAPIISVNCMDMWGLPLLIRLLLRALLAHNIAFVIPHEILSAMRACFKRKSRARDPALKITILRGLVALLDCGKCCRNAFQRIGVTGLGAAL